MLRDRETYYSPLLFFLNCIATFVSYIASLLVYAGLIRPVPRSLPLLQFVFSPSLHWDRMLHLLPLCSDTVHVLLPVREPVDLP